MSENNVIHPNRSPFLGSPNRSPFLGSLLPANAEGWHTGGAHHCRRRGQGFQ